MKKLSIGVIAAHVLLIFIMIVTKPAAAAPTIKKPIVVKTIQPTIQTQEKKQISTSPKPPSPKKPTPKAAAPAKKKVSKATAQKKVAPNLIQELEESIAKIDGKKDKIELKKEINIPKSIDNTPIYRPVEEEDYRELLVASLKQALNLPDFGEVTIQLTLRRSGSVVKLEVMKSMSEKNKEYLEKHLPYLHFPEMTGSFAKKNEQTFLLTFSNE